MYEPEVNDYVIWTDDLGQVNEGWVYFKGEPVDNELRVKHGWNEVSRYITIETGVRPKSKEMLQDSNPHKMVHTLLLCYESQWKNLKFVKRRKSSEIEHWSQYDDRAGNHE